MHRETFEGTVLSGHKEDAVEVPFSPEERWGLEKVKIGPGRLGYPVQATIKGHAFSSHVVARSSRLWLLIPAAAEGAAGVRSGDRVKITLRGPGRDA